MPKQTKDRGVTTFSRQIVVHLHILYGFSQTTHIMTIKRILLEKSATICESDENIRTLKRTMVKKKSIKFV